MTAVLLKSFCVDSDSRTRISASVKFKVRDEGYLRGIREDRPAVIPVNMFFSALVVQEFLARLHPYRNQPNASYAVVRGNLLEPFLATEPDGAPCNVLGRHVGRGDVDPLLDRPDLS
jgi:hypothetical protein